MISQKKNYKSASYKADFSYAAEKLKQKKFSFSDLEVRQYFNENKVLNGLFSLTENLFGVSIQAAQAQTWHEDVRFFNVLRNQQVIAAFYLDPYARNSKRSGAWMDDARGRKALENGIQTPVAYLTCNYTKVRKDSHRILFLNIPGFHILK